MHIGALMANIPKRHTHVKAGKGMRESTNSSTCACQMDQWKTLSMARDAYSVSKKIPTRSICQGTMCQTASAKSGNASRNQEGRT